MRRSKRMKRILREQWECSYLHAHPRTLARVAAFAATLDSTGQRSRPYARPWPRPRRRGPSLCGVRRRIGGFFRNVHGPIDYGLTCLRDCPSDRFCDIACDVGGLDRSITSGAGRCFCPVRNRARGAARDLLRLVHVSPMTASFKLFVLFVLIEQRPKDPGSKAGRAHELAVTSLPRVSAAKYLMRPRHPVERPFAPGRSPNDNGSCRSCASQSARRVPELALQLIRTVWSFIEAVMRSSDRSLPDVCDELETPLVHR